MPRRYIVKISYDAYVIFAKDICSELCNHIISE